MKNEKQLIEQLEKMRTPAPDGFTQRVMNALPERRPKKIWRFWPERQAWIGPALAGAFASLLIVFSVGRFVPAQSAVAGSPQLTFHFELHAPGAGQVELVGSFNNWQSGDIVLRGPDASGHWTADVALPEGQHEYMFLVDGERWVADPNATTYRADGFGHENAVVNVYDSDNT